MHQVPNKLVNDAPYDVRHKTVPGPWKKSQDSCSLGVKDLVESSCGGGLITPLCLLMMPQALTTYDLLLYNIIYHTCAFFCVWEFLWVSCPQSSFSRNFPQIDHDCFKSTHLPTVCKCTPSVPTRLTYLYRYICFTMITYLMVCCLVQILNPKCQT
jgi:hypothetical protein